MMSSSDSLTAFHCSFPYYLSVFHCGYRRLSRWLKSRQFHHFSQASSVFRSAEYSSLDPGSLAVPLKSQLSPISTSKNAALSLGTNQHVFSSYGFSKWSHGKYFLTLRDNLNALMKSYRAKLLEPNYIDACLSALQWWYILPLILIFDERSIIVTVHSSFGLGLYSGTAIQLRLHSLLSSESCTSSSIPNSEWILRTRLNHLLIEACLWSFESTDKKRRSPLGKLLQKVPSCAELNVLTKDKHGVELNVCYNRL